MRRAPEHQVISPEMIVSIHTINGVQLFQFLANKYSRLKWTRSLREVSICDLVVPRRDISVGISDIISMLHWVSVWDHEGKELYWTGPIQGVEQGRTWLSLSAGDPGSLMSRTRCPLTKQWEAADPSEVAGELWDSVIEFHGLHTQPIQRRDPRGDRFDYACVADEKPVDEVMGELVDLGLYWSVVSGHPILGPAPFEPIVALGENHFVDGELTVIRDGSSTYNDILLRAGDHEATAYLPLPGGLRLQTIVQRDSLSGVSNAAKAAQQAVRYSGAIRDAISVPKGATLHPNAPVSIGQLIPSVRVNVQAYGLLSTMELEGVTVTCTSDGPKVAVDLESVNDDLPELIEPQGQQR